MNRLSDPETADRVSGAALSPCAGVHGEGAAPTSAGDERPPVLDAPAEVSLVGLRRSLRWLTASLATFPQYLVDVVSSEEPRYAPTPIEVCHLCDDLQKRADEAANHARLLSNICDILWDRASAEQSERYQHMLDHPEA
jgi:hypothetical protein